MFKERYQIENLIALLLKDPVSHYPTLLKFARSLENRNNKVYREVILLGSLINEVANNNDFSDLKMEDIKLKGQAILEQLWSLQHTSTEEIFEPDLKQKFLNQKPVDKVVCACVDVSKKISHSFSLRNISMVLKLGEITGVVGENGNGKTSLLRLLAGELQPSSGTVHYPLFSTNTKDWIRIKGLIGYVKQTLVPWRGVNIVKHQLKFTASIKNIRGSENTNQYDFIIARLGLEEYQEKLWSELSSGYRLRFELARQLIWQPKLLILDEPLANLDIKSQLRFLHDLRHLTNSISNSMAVVISSQNLYEIEKVADHVIFLSKGSPSFSGPVSDIGGSNNFRCYEVETDSDSLELKQALKNLQLYEIRSDVFSKLIYTSSEVLSDAVLNALSEHHVELKYFRDITHSTRLLFEK